MKLTERYSRIKILRKTVEGLVEGAIAGGMVGITGAIIAPPAVKALNKEFDNFVNNVTGLNMLRMAPVMGDPVRDFYDNDKIYDRFRAVVSYLTVVPVAFTTTAGIWYAAAQRAADGDYITPGILVATNLSSFAIRLGRKVGSYLTKGYASPSNSNDVQGGQTQ